MSAGPFALLTKSNYRMGYVPWSCCSCGWRLEVPVARIDTIVQWIQLRASCVIGGANSHDENPVVTQT